jgi:hypothetical protein
MSKNLERKLQQNHSRLEFVEGSVTIQKVKRKENGKRKH